MTTAAAKTVQARSILANRELDAQAFQGGKELGFGRGVYCRDNCLGAGIV